MGANRTGTVRSEGAPSRGDRGPSKGRLSARPPWTALAILCALCVSVVRVGFAQAPREVVATGGGWRPPVLNVKRGEAVRLSLKTDEEERCFAIDELRIEKRIVPGRATPLEFTPERTGNFPYYDCLNPEGRKGRLAVTD
jgi:hypothetical protein